MASREVKHLRRRTRELEKENAVLLEEKSALVVENAMFEEETTRLVKVKTGQAKYNVKLMADFEELKAQSEVLAEKNVRVIEDNTELINKLFKVHIAYNMLKGEIIAVRSRLQHPFDSVKEEQEEVKAETKGRVKEEYVEDEVMPEVKEEMEVV